MEDPHDGERRGWQLGVDTHHGEVAPHDGGVDPHDGEGGNSAWILIMARWHLTTAT